MAARLGIFGGTFDPPHLGHLILASEARFQLQLTRLLWVPAAMPPHKTSAEVSPPEVRLEMLRRMLKDEPAFELSKVDIDRPGPHYTLETVTLIRRQHPRSEVILVIGGDSLHDLPSWHQPIALVEACDEIGVMRRPGDAIVLPELERALPGLAQKVRFVDAPLLEISSREIRERAAAGLPFRYFLHPEVYRYIVEHGTYSDT